MITETKRIITLLLAGLLIILTMSTFSVSATTDSTPIATVSAETIEISKGEESTTVKMPIYFTGDVTLNTLQVSIGFDENVKFLSYAPGDCYKGGAVLGVPAAGTESPIDIGWMDTMVMGVKFSNGTFANLEFEVPNSEVNTYEFTISIAMCQLSDWSDVTNSIATVNGVVSVVEDTTPAGPVVKFTNGATEVEDVVAGTMELNVDLNGDESDLIIFAIYAENGEYPTMEYSQEATIVCGKATATINNITLANGTNYYAKAFLWDSTTYYGTSHIIGK